MLSPTLSPSNPPESAYSYYNPPSSSDSSENSSPLKYYPLLLFVIVILFVVAEGSKPNPYDNHRRLIRYHFRWQRRQEINPSTPAPETLTPVPAEEREGGSVVCAYRLEKSNIIDGTDCVICLEEYKLGEECRVFKNCNHGFHKACIDQWLVLDFHCPLCRSAIHGFSQV